MQLVGLDLCKWSPWAIKYEECWTGRLAHVITVLHVEQIHDSWVLGLYMVIRVHVSLHTYIHPVKNQSIQYALQVLYAAGRCTSCSSEQCNYFFGSMSGRLHCNIHSDGDLYSWAFVQLMMGLQGRAFHLSWFEENHKPSNHVHILMGNVRRVVDQVVRRVDSGTIDVHNEAGDCVDRRWSD